MTSHIQNKCGGKTIQQDRMQLRSKVHETEISQSHQLETGEELGPTVNNLGPRERRPVQHRGIRICRWSLHSNLIFGIWSQNMVERTTYRSMGATKKYSRQLLQRNFPRMCRLSTSTCKIWWRIRTSKRPDVTQKQLQCLKKLKYFSLVLM